MLAGHRGCEMHCCKLPICIKGEEGIVGAENVRKSRRKVEDEIEIRHERERTVTFRGDGRERGRETLKAARRNCQESLS